MKSLMCSIVLSILLSACPLTAAISADSGKPVFLKRSGTQLLLDGKPFRAVSVVKYDLFRQFLMEDGEKAAANIRDMSKRGFSLTRAGMVGFYPQEMELWPSAEYWKRMDAAVTVARENNIKLIPTIVWNWYLFTDMANETMQDLLTNKDSKSRQYLDLYVSQVVERYKDDPTILFWEIGNELNLGADLEFMRPYGFSELNLVASGAAYMRVRRDNYTSDQMIPFTRDLAKLIKSIDKNHLVSTGQSAPRPAAQHLRLANGKGDWTGDSPEEAETYIRDLTPDPVDLISLHYYPGIDNLRFGNKNKNSAIALRDLKKICDRIGKPGYIGETGGEAYAGTPESVSPFTADVIKEAVDAKFPIILYWLTGGENPLQFDLDKTPALNKLLLKANGQLTIDN